MSNVQVTSLQGCKAQSRELHAYLFIGSWVLVWIENFEPENYTDDVRHHMLELIKQAVNGLAIVIAQEAHEETKTIVILENYTRQNAR